MTTQQSVLYPRTLNMLWRAAFWISFPFGMLSFALPIYGKELKASAFEIGGFFAAFSLVSVIVRPFLGRALDRWGRRPFLLLGLSSYAIAMLVFSMANSVWILTLARLIQGIGQAFLWISAYTIIADVTGQGRDFGSIDEAVNRGAVIGTVGGFAALLIFRDSAGMDWQFIWKWLFLFYTATALLALWNAWRGVPETLPRVTGRIENT